jgi:hypothetical protein
VPGYGVNWRLSGSCRKGPPQKKHSHTEYDGPTQDKLSIKPNQALFSSFHNFSVIFGQSSAILGQFFSKFFVLPSKCHMVHDLCLVCLPSTMLSTCGAPILRYLHFRTKPTPNPVQLRADYIFAKNRNLVWKHAKGQFNGSDCRYSPPLSTTISIRSPSAM